MFEKKPMEVERNGIPVVKANIYLLYCIGDGLEQQNLMNHGGVGSTYGCRYCICKGEHPNDKDTNRGMYFLDTKAAIRTKDSLMLKDASVPSVSNI